MGTTSPWGAWRKPEAAQSGTTKWLALMNKKDALKCLQTLYYGLANAKVTHQLAGNVVHFPTRMGSGSLVGQRGKENGCFYGNGESNTDCNKANMPRRILGKSKRSTARPKSKCSLSLPAPWTTKERKLHKRTHKQASQAGDHKKWTKKRNALMPSQRG